MSEQTLLSRVLNHNPAVRAALEKAYPGVMECPDWVALSDALGGGSVDTVVAAFLGNKSERVMLAALLMKADFAAQAVDVSSNFWVAWGGLDRRNRGLLLALLDEDLLD